PEVSGDGVPGIPGPVDVATDGAGDGAFWPCTSGGEQTTATVARTARASDEIREMDMGGVFECYGSGGSLSATVSVWPSRTRTGVADSRTDSTVSSDIASFGSRST